MNECGQGAVVDGKIVIFRERSLILDNDSNGHLLPGCDTCGSCSNSEYCNVMFRRANNLYSLYSHALKNIVNVNDSQANGEGFEVSGVAWAKGRVGRHRDRVGFRTSV